MSLASQLRARVAAFAFLVGVAASALAFVYSILIDLPANQRAAQSFVIFGWSAQLALLPLIALAGIIIAKQNYPKIRVKQPWVAALTMPAVFFLMIAAIPTRVCCGPFASIDRVMLGAVFFWSFAPVIAHYFIATGQPKWKNRFRNVPALSTLLMLGPAIGWALSVVFQSDKVLATSDVFNPLTPDLRAQFLQMILIAAAVGLFICGYVLARIPRVPANSIRVLRREILTSNSLTVREAQERFSQALVEIEINDLWEEEE